MNSKEIKRRLMERVTAAGVDEGVCLWQIKNRDLESAVRLIDAGRAVQARKWFRRVKERKSAKKQQASAKPARRATPSAEFYASAEWKRLRYQALVKNGAACQCCGATRAGGVTLHVDHIKPRSKYPELELSLDNLQVLCEPCNMGKSAWDETDWR
jgi:5-methylcytosine-specific restriction endonuclease McrA